MICGVIVRAPASGPGSVAAAGTMPAGSTGPRARPQSATCWEDAIPLAPGSTLPATCGCSVAMATTQSGTWATSTTCGNTIRALGIDLVNGSELYDDRSRVSPGACQPSQSGLFHRYL